MSFLKKIHGKVALENKTAKQLLTYAKQLDRNWMLLDKKLKDARTVIQEKKIDERIRINEENLSQVGEAFDKLVADSGLSEEEFLKQEKIYNDPMTHLLTEK